MSERFIGDQGEREQGNLTGEQRTHATKEVRQIAANMGLRELADKPARYEDPTNAASSVLVDWETFDAGQFSAKIDHQGQVTVTVPGDAPAVIRTAVQMRDLLKGVGVDPLVVDRDGHMVILPDQPKTPSQPDQPSTPLRPLEDQALTFDPKTGQWYGAPKP